MKLDRLTTKRRRWSAAVLLISALAAVFTVDLSRGCGQSPYAAEVISENGAYGSAPLYNDPNAVLGEPTRIAVNGDPLLGGTPFHVKIVEQAYNREYLTNKNVVATLGRKSDGMGGFIYGSITVKFDHAVVNDPANPYGIDLNVFGNAFYVGSGLPNDTTDMRTHNLVGGIFVEPVVISVSPNNENWYTYSAGPFGDTAFPTQGYEWIAAQHDVTGNGWTTTATDFTKPVNPTLSSVLGATGQGMATVDAMTTYVGSGGGTGIDLAESGFNWIQYVRVQSTAQHRDGEIDGFADVRPMHVGESLSITPANVASHTKLYFQNPTELSRTDVVADFTSISDLAKLSTNAVTDPTALAALANRQLFTSFQLDVSRLIGAGDVTLGVNYELSAGSIYSGSGGGLEVLAWNGSAWNSLPFTFDSLTNHAMLTGWTEPSATIALVGLAGDFNRDGSVDAADYVVYRRGIGSTYVPDDYNVWRSNFGATLSSASGATLLENVPVPEPLSWMLTLLAAFGMLTRRRSRTRIDR